MIPPLELLRQHCGRVLKQKQTQGHDIDEAQSRFEALAHSYDAVIEFGNGLDSLPMRKDWPYEEPTAWVDIKDEMDSERVTTPIRDDILAQDLVPRIENAFICSAAGCMLGKPVEVNPTLDELRHALECIGEWPLRDYFRVETFDGIAELRPGKIARHDSWRETTRGNIHHVAADDDLNYTILGMEVIEEHGAGFTHEHLREKWLGNVPVGWAWGPERIHLTRFALQSLFEADGDVHPWARSWSLGDELCGAAIRADAYGYAAAGNPELAAKLAHVDASLTHQRNGVYAPMYIAAAIATAAVLDDPWQVHQTALAYIPQRSRLAEVMRFALEQARVADDWLDAYRRINQRYGQYRHCQVYQELADLVVSLCFADDAADCFCKQVMMGNDTDSFGCTAGSLGGIFFGPGSLDTRWTEPLNNRIQTTLAGFHVQNLDAVAARMGQLPARLIDVETDRFEGAVQGNVLDGAAY